MLSHDTRKKKKQILKFRDVSSILTFNTEQALNLNGEEFLDMELEYIIWIFPCPMTVVPHVGVVQQFHLGFHVLKIIFH